MGGCLAAMLGADPATEVDTEGQSTIYDGYDKLRLGWAGINSWVEFPDSGRRSSIDPAVACCYTFFLHPHRRMRERELVAANPCAMTT